MVTFSFLRIVGSVIYRYNKKEERDGISKVDWYMKNTVPKKRVNRYNRAGHSQSTVLAAPWRAPLILLVSKIPSEVVALTGSRGLQFSYI